MKEKSRLTVDMSPDEHMYIKMACAKLGVTMRDLILYATFEKIEEIEDAWLAEKAKETLKNIDLGLEKTLPWETVKKRLRK